MNVAIRFPGQLNGEAVTRSGALLRSTQRSWFGRRAVLCSCAIVLAMVPAAGHAEKLSLAAFTNLAQRCGSSVAVPTLAAVAKTESNFRTLVVADNTTGKTRDFATLEEAVVAGENLVNRGHSVDLGLMQINSANLRRLGYRVRDALDPCRSVSGGALILSRNYAAVRDGTDPQVALRRALSRYNTGNVYAGYRNGYVRRIEDAARSLLSVATPIYAAALAQATAQQSSTVSWDVWNSIQRSITAPAVVPSENPLVF